jgi:hypothetical protein
MDGVEGRFNSVKHKLVTWHYLEVRSLISLSHLALLRALVLALVRSFASLHCPDYLVSINPDHLQDFGVDSLSLVERLFADLVLATRSYQDLERRNEQLEDMAEQKDLMLMPLKQENAKVARENNQVRELPRCTQAWI